MMLSPQDAAGALRDIEAAQARSAQLHGYARSSPQLVLWGVLWVIGYGLNDFFPAYSGAIWGAVVPIGLIAGFAALRGTGQGWLALRSGGRDVRCIFCGRFFHPMADQSEADRCLDSAWRRRRLRDRRHLVGATIRHHRNSDCGADAGRVRSFEAALLSLDGWSRRRLPDPGGHLAQAGLRWCKRTISSINRRD